jgi:hypothetical protein
MFFLLDGLFALSLCHFAEPLFAGCGLLLLALLVDDLLAGAVDEAGPVRAERDGGRGQLVQQAVDLGLPPLPLRLERVARETVEVGLGRAWHDY